MQVHTRTVFLYAFIVAIGGFVFGFDAAVIGGAVGYITRQLALDPWQVGLIVTAPTLAAVVASFTIGFVSDIFGRKRVLIFLAGLYVTSAFLSATAQSFWIVSDFWALFIARAIGGYAFGSLPLAPVYIAEIAPPQLRGRLVGINQLTIVIGFSAAYFSNLLIQNLSASDAAWVLSSGMGAEPWRWMLGAELIPAGVWLLAMFAIPESPRWLATKGRYGEAERVLDKTLPHGEALEALRCLKEQIEEAARASKSRFGDLLKPSIRYALAIGIIIAIIQQITGINTVFFYATTIFELSGIGTNAAFAQTIWVGVTNVVFTLIAMALVDKMGRRPLMIVGLIGVAASFSLVAYGFISADYVLRADDLTALASIVSEDALRPLVDTVYVNDVAFEAALTEAIAASGMNAQDIIRDNRGLLLSVAMEGRPVLILAGIIGFVAAFALSLGPVMWIFLAEIFPSRVRGTAISFVTIFNSGTSSLVTMIFPIQVSALGVASVFIGYTAFAVIGLLLVIWLMPETKGLSLEQLEKKMAEGRAGR